MPELDINVLYQMLLKISDETVSRLDAMDKKVAGLASIVSQAADSKSTREAIVMLEKSVNATRAANDSLRQQMELYMNRDQLLNHTHDGLNSEKISYRNLKDRELESQLASKASAERGYDLAGIGTTGTAVTFAVSYEAMPYVVPVLLKSDVPNANRVARTDLSATPLGFIVRAYTADGLEVKGIPFSYLAWKPSV